MVMQMVLKYVDVKKCVRIIYFGVFVGEIIHQLHGLT